MSLNRISPALSEAEHALRLFLFNLKKISQSFCLETVIFFKVDLKVLNVVTVNHREMCVCVCVCLGMCLCVCKYM